MKTDRTTLRAAFGRHERSWEQNLYVYAVISRRSRGVSVGINLNPDKGCNFDCVYCQVDRTVPPAIRKVDLQVLETELHRLLDAAESGALFTRAPFDALLPSDRTIRDIAFSGDGEPTTYPRFKEAVEIAARARRQHQLDATKLVLITDAAYLTKPQVREALALLDANNGEIWAKLDAGTQTYFEAVDRPNVTLDAILANVLDAARSRPIVIQTLWMRLHGVPPPAEEIEANCDRLCDLLRDGAQIKAVQLYTVARKPAEGFVEPLRDAELDAIAARVRARVSVPIEVYYGVT